MVKLWLHKVPRWDQQRPRGIHAETWNLINEGVSCEHDQKGVPLRLQLAKKTPALTGSYTRKGLDFRQANMNAHIDWSREVTISENTDSTCVMIVTPYEYNPMDIRMTTSEAQEIPWKVSDLAGIRVLVEKWKLVLFDNSVHREQWRKKFDHE
jgi:hypothetical protein